MKKKEGMNYIKKLNKFQFYEMFKMVDPFTLVKMRLVCKKIDSFYGQFVHELPKSISEFPRTYWPDGHYYF